MKKIKLIAAAVAVCAAMPAMAQFTGAGASNAASSADNENYQRITVGYNGIFASPKGGESTTLNGFAAGYTYGLSLSSAMPLYLEFGGQLAYGSGSDKTSLMSIGIPVNVAYRFNITDAISVTPYTGLNFRVNVIGKAYGINMFSGKSDDNNDWGDGWEDWEDYSTYSSRGDDYDWDDEDLYGDADDWKWKRFQMGWQIGAGVNFNKWYAGLRYELDFIKLQKYLNTSTLNVSVGYTF